MKKIIACLTLVCVLFCGAMFASCGFFEDETLIIESIDAQTMEDGSTKVTITYLDDVSDPVVFYIPKGERGEIGNGIKEVKHEVKDGENIVTLIFDDENIEDMVFTVKNGRSITGVSELELEELTGKYFFRINYSDGQSETVYVPQGKDGNGIKAYFLEETDEGGYVLTFTFDDESLEPLVINIPKGEKGVGIQKVTSVNESPYEWSIQFTFSDGSTETASFKRANQWLTGPGKPNQEVGIPGDFYWDTTTKNIYFKDAIKGWTVMYDVDGVQEDDCHVSFDLNVNDGSASFPQDINGEYVPAEYYIQPGTNFYGSGYSIPIPTRDGYTFVGWFTDKTATVVSGQLTSLTTITCDMVLYACWQKNQ